MSYSMYEYDINGDKQWIDSFKSISEQAPEDTRYAVLSSNSEGFTDDLDKAISEVQEKNIQGQTILYLFWTGQLVCLMKNQVTGIKLS